MKKEKDNIQRTHRTKVNIQAKCCHNIGHYQSVRERVIHLFVLQRDVSHLTACAEMRQRAINTSAACLTAYVGSDTETGWAPPSRLHASGWTHSAECSGSQEEVGGRRSWQTSKLTRRASQNSFQPCDPLKAGNSHDPRGQRRQNRAEKKWAVIVGGGGSWKGPGLFNEAPQWLEKGAVWELWQFIVLF